MKDTIKAKNAYHVRRIKSELMGEFIYQRGKPYFINHQTRLVVDGKMPVTLADLVDKNDYEYEKENNECFKLYEVFTTAKGNRFIYWRDEEMDQDFITRI